MLQTFCEALQEMNEKITSTDADAKSVGKSTHGFHQAFLHFDCSWLIFLRSWNCIPVRIVSIQYCAIPATQRNAIRLGRTMSYPRTVYFLYFVYFGCLWSQQSYSYSVSLGFPSREHSRCWQKFRSRWVRLMLKWKKLERTQKECSRFLSL